MAGVDAVLILLGVLLGSAIFLADINLPLGVATGALYCLVVVYSWVLPGAFAPAIAAVICTVLITLGFQLSEARGVDPTFVGLNRVISVLVVWMTATLAVLAKRSFEALERARYGLEQQVRDRTREIELARDRLELMTREIVDYSILLLGVDGRVESWNSGAERIAGYSAKEIVGEPFELLFDVEDRQSGGPGLLLERAGSEGRAEQEAWHLRKDGDRYWARTTLTALRDGRGGTFGFSAVTRDLTEQRQAREALETYAEELLIKNRELEHFTFVASHDLQEPLRSVSLFADLLGRRYGDHLDHQADDFIRRIMAATRRMTALIQDLLEYSQLPMVSSSLTDVDTQELVDEVCSDLSAAVLEQDARIDYDNLPTVPGVPAQLAQLFANLVGNALKFSSEEPARIRISAHEQRRCWRFEVVDNGIGVAEPYREKIFGVFQRLHDRNKYEGTGIGLAICQRIVSHHGGSIGVESPQGGGSTFWFTLPKKGASKHQELSGAFRATESGKVFGQSSAG